jgi:hypothetical protein
MAAACIGGPNPALAASGLQYFNTSDGQPGLGAVNLVGVVSSPSVGLFCACVNVCLHLSTYTYPRSPTPPRLLRVHLQDVAGVTEVTCVRNVQR